MSWYIEECAEWIKRRGYSEALQTATRLHVGQFRDWIIQFDVHEITDILPRHIKDFQKEWPKRITQYGTPYKPGTLNHVYQDLKRYFRWLKKEGYIALELAHQFEYIKEPQALPGVVLSDKEVRKILNVFDTHTTLGLRNRAILELLYSTGIRRSELVNLNVEDIDFEGGMVRITKGKGGKDRIVPLGKHASHHLENYVKGVQPLLKMDKKEKALFLAQGRGRRICLQSLKEIIDQAAARSEVGKKITPHVFRRSCATGMIKNKAHPFYVKELLGHSSLESLEPYLKLSIVDLKEVHAKCHPRERQEG